MNLQTQLFDKPPDDNPLDLPERVLCLSLWQPYAGLVVAGVKTIETRTWKWPYPVPSWLVIHAAKSVHPDLDRRLAYKMKRVAPRLKIPIGAYLGIVRVDACRPLTPQDEEAACVYEEGLWAWELSNATPFAKPVPVERGPQKFVRLPRSSVLEWLK
jgi:hypothetical protein